MIDFTPFQCFLIGVASMGLISGLFAVWVQRSVARLKREDPDWFVKVQAKRQEAVAWKDEEAQLHRQQLELLERIAENQERMIEIMRETQRERYE